MVDIDRLMPVAIAEVGTENLGGGNSTKTC